jgi:predicted transcriptional regulator YheO
MGLQRAVYRPRDAAHTVLHQVIAEHLDVFLHAVAEASEGQAASHDLSRREIHQQIVLLELQHLIRPRRSNARIRARSSGIAKGLTR